MGFVHLYGYQNYKKNQIAISNIIYGPTPVYTGAWRSLIEYVLAEPVTGETVTDWNGHRLDQLPVKRPPVRPVTGETVTDWNGHRLDQLPVERLPVGPVTGETVTG
ncbi:unnamed protein product [Rotaria magnacalcarata]|uniref:Uncharacterized protein n=1 Tax=Rotaria magnacalcarata TaxID=392030 RepID=A0A8S3GNU7_9BILA|nr:unnamed protein product [Rotaria magnacalcarata]